MEINEPQQSALAVEEVFIKKNRHGFYNFIIKHNNKLYFSNHVDHTYKVAKQNLAFFRQCLTEADSVNKLFWLRQNTKYITKFGTPSAALSSGIRTVRGFKRSGDFNAE